MAAERSAITLTVDDYDAVIALWQIAGLSSIRLNGRDSREEFAKQLSKDTQTVLGVHNDAELVAVIVVTHDGRKGWLNRLAVHPGWRRQGLGTFLIAEAERVLKQQGIQIFAALVEDWNDASLAMMTKAGYADYPGIHYLRKLENDDV